jgi:nicotinate dehydrogenase subunit A
MSERIALKVNGKAAEVEADPAMPLLYALRNGFGLNNPHFGCGLGQCGACTVEVNGRPVRSCVVTMGAVRGKEVVTLGGMGAEGALHPLQKAWIEEQVSQCGYCTAGWIMTAAALLKTNKNPTDAEIRKALTGLKCRCGTHLAIIRAVKRAAREMATA